MTWFEERICGNGSNRLTNCATTTARHMASLQYGLYAVSVRKYCLIRVADEWGFEPGFCGVRFLLQLCHNLCHRFASYSNTKWSYRCWMPSVDFPIIRYFIVVITQNTKMRKHKWAINYELCKLAVWPDLAFFRLFICFLAKFWTYVCQVFVLLAKFHCFKWQNILAMWSYC